MKEVDGVRRAASPASAPGSAGKPLPDGEEPVVTGTLFLVMLLLMIIGAVWIIMYLRLLQ